ncbi:MAG TPA: hypothetical protein VGD76_11010 [Ramlibacter sp.]
MLRRASVLLGLAVLLSLVFPLKGLLAQSGARAFLGPVGADLMLLCVLLALVPAVGLFHDAHLARRIPRWNVWVALLALSSVVFLLLHFPWSLELAVSYAKEALPAGMPHRAILSAAELGARIGVLVSLVGVLVNLDAAPEMDREDSVRRRKK